VAVTASVATLGIATETGVSIRSPATNSSIVGIAPSRGLVSRAGVIPVSFTQDRVGSHAKTVIDAALLLEAIRGFDAADLSTAAGLGRTSSQSLAQPGTGLEGKRVGVLRDLFRQGAEFEPINQRIDLLLRTIPGHGAVLVDSLSTRLDLVAMMPTLRVSSYELRPAFDAYLLRRGPASPVETFADLGRPTRAWRTTTSVPSPVFPRSSCRQARARKACPSRSSFWAGPLRRRRWWPLLTASSRPRSRAFSRTPHRPGERVPY
jgi:amidase